MDPISPTRLQTIDSEDLTPIVRQALNSPNARVLDWQSTALIGGSAHAVTGGIGIYRFFGTAQIEDQVLPWSVVLKARSSASKQAVHDPTSLHYWRRELLIYQCRLFDDVGGGFALPCCYGAVEHENGEQWLWLEYIEESKEIWPLERFALAARHLGQFNAASLLHHWPVYSWFSSGFMREWPASQAPVLQELHQWIKQPHSWLTPSDADRILCLYQERDRFQSALEQLPRCWCHHDAFSRNLIARRTPNSEEETVVIDWATAGMGVIGEDIARLTTMSLGFLEVTPADPVQLDKLVFAGYMEGLYAAGWRGEEDTVRLGYTAACALIMGVGGIVRFLPLLVDPARRAWAEETFHAPLDMILACWRDLHEFTLDLGDEARMLLKRLA
jgi:hypothetical protein